MNKPKKQKFHIEDDIIADIPLFLLGFLFFTWICSILFGLRLSSFHFHWIRFSLSLHLYPYITCEQEFALGGQNTEYIKIRDF
ncbi:unnamed protein product [Lactuca virosa]|uniref:Uncharacterized protein n=1 Tax=Lactuca virosa TaxID=75947 RepID=A0AAU9LK00_9ASTR|nr:unnamed protein product [Lactuca virosa]